MRRWLQAQQRDLLNTANCFHVAVFTRAHELNPLALTSPRPFLDLLFGASSQTLLRSRLPIPNGGWCRRSGFLVHPACTWSQRPARTLPCPLHRLFPPRGLSPDRKALDPHQPCPLFLLPIPILHTVFRKKFLRQTPLSALHCKNQLNLPEVQPLDFSDPAWFQQLMKKLENKDWFVYAKPPFGGPDPCPALSRSLHPPRMRHQQPPPHRLRLDRARHLPPGEDHAHGGKQRVMTLDTDGVPAPLPLHVHPEVSCASPTTTACC